MNNSKISVRYAKALFQVAVQQNVEDAVRNDVESLLECINTMPDFKLLLENPVVSDTKKVEIFNAIFAGKFQKLTTDFFGILIKNKREEFLKIICLDYLGFYTKSKNIKQVTVTSAVEVDDVAKQIEALIKSQDTNSTVELTSKLDPGIIGGLIIQIDDKVYDASIKSQLARIREKLK